VVSEEGISTYPDKIKTVQDWPRPKTPKQMRGLSWSLLLLQEICEKTLYLDDVSKLYKVSVIMHLHCCVAYLEMIIKVCSQSSFH
jgi:hypothetical protein